MRRNRIQYFELFAGATILARTDGLFVVRISIARDPERAFPPSDIDELALYVCMAAKQKLGHVHDVHNRRDAQPEPPVGKIAPSEILHVEPVQLEAAAWSVHFSRRQLGDETLRSALSVPRKYYAGDQPRNALICLRRAYFRLSEGFQGVLNALRTEKRRRTRSWWRRSWIAAITLVISAGFLFASLNGEQTPVKIACFIFAWGGAYLAWSEVGKFRTFEKSIIRLLRAAATFFHHANPLNEIVRRVVNPAPADSFEVQDFTSLIGSLQIRAEGESHRASVSQYFATLGFSIAGVALTLLVTMPTLLDPLLASPTPDAFASRPGATFVSIDCGEDSGLRVGPFANGRADQLEPASSSPQHALASIAFSNQTARQPALILVVGSAEETETGEADAAPTALATARADWVRNSIEGFFETEHLPAPEVLAFSDGMPFLKFILGQEFVGGGRDAFVCAAWFDEIEPAD